MLELYRRIWTVTGRQQIVLIILSLLIAGLASVPLQLQKDIVNGLSDNMTIRHLLLLCSAYLAVLALNGALKFAMNYRSAALSEGVVKFIRTRIVDQSSQQSPAPDIERGRLVTMIASESEQVGNFVGGSIASPLLQVGTLISVIGFVTVSQPHLGLLILLVIAPQAVLVLVLQKSINKKVSDRVTLMRQATNEIAAHEIAQVRQNVLSEFDQIYETRCQIFKLKLSMKFINNLIFGIGIAGILLLGGYLVLNNRSDVGTVVASLSALTRVSDPWRELIAFYRQLNAARVQFDLLISALPQSRQAQAS